MLRWYRAVVVMLLLSWVRVQIRRWPRVIAIIIVYGVTVVSRRTLLHIITTTVVILLWMAVVLVRLLLRGCPTLLVGVIPRAAAATTAVSTVI